MVVWLLIGAVLVYGALRLVTSSAPSVETISASEFYNMIKNRPEEINSVQVDKDWIKGEYSSGHKQGYEGFRTARDLDSEFPLEETLLANNIEFKYPDPSRFPQWLGFFAGGLLPLLLLIGFMYFISRQMQGTGNRALVR